MDVPFSDLRAQYSSIKVEIDQAVINVLESGQYIGGKTVKQFEEGFTHMLRAGHAVGVGNGTDAIFVALKSLGLKRGDEVIVPAFGWLSASEMISLSGAKVVFADVLPCGTIDPKEIEFKITSRTKAVVVVHLYGQAAHAHEVQHLCVNRKLYMIEDCAQAHLTSENGIYAGTIGEAGTFSFYPTKNLGAYGDAGCVVTNNKTLAESMRLFANHGGLEVHAMEGINSRLDPIQAAILNVKCGYLEKWTARREANAQVYLESLKNIAGISLPSVRENTRHTFHQFVIRTERRDALKEYLLKHGIQTLIHYPKAIHCLPAYRYLNHRAEDFPEAVKCADQVLSLPVYPELSKEQIHFVCEKITQFFI